MCRSSELSISKSMPCRKKSSCISIKAIPISFALTSDLASEFRVQSKDLSVELFPDDLLLLLGISLGQKLHKVVAGAGCSRNRAPRGGSSGHTSGHRRDLGSTGRSRLVTSTLVELHLHTNNIITVALGGLPTDHLPAG